MAHVLPTTEEKAAYVERMFAHIAPTYDRTNRVMTFGLDQVWRQRVVEYTAPLMDSRVLDIGTGTGDFLPLLAAWSTKGLVTGVDFCTPMMRESWGKVQASAFGTIALVGADALQLPFPDASFDAITTGFTIRNVTDREASFREMWRVCTSGGVLACLEVTHPRNSMLRTMHRLYFRYIVPLIGGYISGNRQAYVYLHESARAFPPPDTLANEMRQAGWQHVHYTLRSFGAVAIHIGVKV